jgi:hypothetical protein
MNEKIRESQSSLRALKEEKRSASVLMSNS